MAVATGGRFHRPRPGVAKRAGNSFVVTFIAVVIVAAFLSPLLRSFTISLKNPDQINELNGPVYVQEGGTSLLDEDAAHFAKLHILFILAREQMKTMVFFDLIDLFADCGLSEVQPFCSPSEIHFLGQDKDCL